MNEPIVVNRRAPISVSLNAPWVQLVVLSVAAVPFRYAMRLAVPENTAAQCAHWPADVLPDVSEMAVTLPSESACTCPDERLSRQ